MKNQRCAKNAFGRRAPEITKSMEIIYKSYQNAKKTMKNKRCAQNAFGRRAPEITKSMEIHGNHIEIISKCYENHRKQALRPKCFWAPRARNHQIHGNPWKSCRNRIKMF